MSQLISHLIANFICQLKFMWENPCLRSGENIGTGFRWGEFQLDAFHLGKGGSWKTRHLFLISKEIILLNPDKKGGGLKNSISEGHSKSWIVS